jgi:hypothetical protein
VKVTVFEVVLTVPVRVGVLGAIQEYSHQRSAYPPAGQVVEVSETDDPGVGALLWQVVLLVQRV